MDPSPAEVGLERLLAQLLRAVSPPAVEGNRESRPDAKEDTGGPAARSPAVSASEARALIEVAAARGIAQGELAALLGLEKSTVSRLAAGLERKGWIRRGRDEANQRYVRLYLTLRGKSVADQVWQAWQSRQQRILASMSAEERAGLAAGLRGLIRGLAAEGLLGDRQKATAAPPATQRQKTAAAAPRAQRHGPAGRLGEPGSQR